MSFTIQRILGIAPVMVLGLLLLTPAPGLAQVPRPDLVVNSLTRRRRRPRCRGTASGSRPSVRNQGTGAAGASITKFFLVTAPGSATSEEPQGHPDRPGPSALGASAALASWRLKIYSDTVPGNVFSCRPAPTAATPRSRRATTAQQLLPDDRDDHRVRRAGPRDDGDHRPAVVGAAGAELRRDLYREEHGGGIRAPRPWSSSRWCRPSAAVQDRPEDQRSARRWDARLRGDVHAHPPA